MRLRTTGRTGSLWRRTIFILLDDDDKTVGECHFSEEEGKEKRQVIDVKPGRTKNVEIWVNELKVKKIEFRKINPTTRQRATVFIVDVA